jgi:hypothetical protein
MGQRKITIKTEVAEEIADISFFIESKGLKETAIKFTKSVLSFIRGLNFDDVEFAKCRDLSRASLGLKCIPYNKKYTIVFYQFEKEVIITEFVLSKMIHW